MKRIPFKKSVLWTASAIALLHSAVAYAQDGGCGVCETYTQGPSIQDANPRRMIFDNGPVSFEMDRPGSWSGGGDGGYTWIPAEVSGWFGNFVNRYVLGGMNDRGSWLCTSCSVQPTPDGATEWAAFITTVVNKQLWPNLVDGAGKGIGQWKPGDTIGICNGGGLCVVLTWQMNNGSVGWLPDLMNQPIWVLVKVDKGKYQNKGDTSGPGASIDGDTIRLPIFDSNRRLVAWVVTNQLPTGITVINLNHILPKGTVTSGPLERVDDPNGPQPGDPGSTEPEPVAPSDPGGGGGGDGGGCVHVDSILPDGRRAGDIRVGDTMQLGDEYTINLDSTVGLVSYSEEKTMAGFRITTQSGISLVCSDTAPLWTDEGYVLAPSVCGKRVAIRIDGSNAIETRFEVVEVVEAVGPIQVQHITVGNRAFWAGANRGAYILHHNLKESG